jgi:hypothetical protein
MLVGRINKQPLQVSRFTVNFAEWLDAGETITAVTVPAITVLGTSWNGPWPPQPVFSSPTPPVIDPTEQLSLVGTYTLIGGTMVQCFVQSGQIGLVYQVQFVITGSSNRQKPVEVQIQMVSP